MGISALKHKPNLTGPSHPKPEEINTESYMNVKRADVHLFP